MDPVPSRRGPSSSSPWQTGEAQRLPRCDTRHVGHGGRTQCHMLLGLPLWGSLGRTRLN